jgi:hypothetical protein
MSTQGRLRLMISEEWEENSVCGLRRVGVKECVFGAWKTLTQNRQHVHREEEGV